MSQDAAAPTPRPPTAASRAWRCRGRVLVLDAARVMGILNVTPDSFSDGGSFLDVGRAVAHGESLVADGATLLDIGGESTRPGAAAVSTAEEIRRVLPVLARLRADLPPDVLLSVDTRNPEVAAAALDAGADVINDVGAGRADPSLWQHVARHGAGYVAMHMQGEPGTMQQAPRYGDVLAEVRGFFEDRLARLAEAGVDPGQVVLDPGIGFGKNLEHNLALVRQPCLVDPLGRPVMLGVSRKSFLGALLGAPVDRRLAAGLAVTLWGASRGVSLFRTHDVAETVQALRMWEVLDGRGDTPHPGHADT